MEEQDSLRTFLYGWARFGLFWLISIFATIIGRTAILGIVGTLIPRLMLYDNMVLLSFFSWIVVMAFLFPLFWDDGKRHTAYGTYNPTAVTIILLLTAVAFYAPVFILEYMEDRKVVATIEGLYFSDFWLSPLNEDPQIYALLGTALTIIICIAAYVVSHIYYRGKFDEEDV